MRVDQIKYGVGGENVEMKGVDVADTSGRVLERGGARYCFSLVYLVYGTVLLLGHSIVTAHYYYYYYYSF
jgi:hypothetical protein